MPRLALGVGALLILPGLGGYVATGGVSWTALIPVFFGLPIAALGAIALKCGGTVRMHAMHGAIVVALLGLAGSASGVPRVVRLLTGDDVARPAAVVAKNDHGAVVRLVRRAQHQILSRCATKAAREAKTTLMVGYVAERRVRRSARNYERGS